MTPYVAMLWDLSNPTANASAAALSQRFRAENSSFETGFSAPGITLYSRRQYNGRNQITLLPDARGAIVGAYFKDLEASLSTYGSESEAFRFSGALDFVTRHWGSYVGFFNDHELGRTFVIRDCSGMIPCYRTSVGPIELVFSDVADLDGVVLPRFRVNKQYLRAFLYSSELQVRDCGIENVTEILAGEFFTLCGTQREQGIWWDPAEICRT